MPGQGQTGREVTRVPTTALGAFIAIVLVVAAACSGSAPDSGPSIEASAARGPNPVQPKSIVQLGDSIASGEGTLYGYTYDKDSDEWTGGNVNVTWPPPYPECHVSPDAYGNAVAAGFGAAFHQFACTGATFDSGIAAPEVVDGTTRRPAEFGNWSTMQDLNAEYDAAAPDLVLITLGADDVNFSGIVEECIKNGYKYYWGLAKLQCVEGNPGPTVQKDFLDYLPTLKKDYATLVSWIEERAEHNNVPVPNIVFTNYADPLPPKGTTCNDTNWLYEQQIDYLRTLLDQMNGIIESTIRGLDKKNVAVADISEAYQRAGVDHRWCSDDPWAYGLSIYRLTDPSSFKSQAPFHPTPDGQESIAESVIPTIINLFDSELPIDTTTTTPTSEPPPTTAPATTEPAAPTTESPPTTEEPSPSSTDDTTTTES